MYIEGALISNLRRYESVAGGPELALAHFRGSISSSSNVVQNDELGKITFGGYASGTKTGAQILTIVLDQIEGVENGSARGVPPPQLIEA